jgi:hypothetical protein
MGCPSDDVMGKDLFNMTGDPRLHACPPDLDCHKSDIFAVLLGIGNL